MSQNENSRARRDLFVRDDGKEYPILVIERKGYKWYRVFSGGDKKCETLLEHVTDIQAFVERPSGDPGDDVPF